MSKIANRVKQPFQDTNKLSWIFKQEPNLAWDMVEQECNIYTNPNIDVEEINKLNSIYCPYLQRVVLRLNEMQDPRQKYFNNKMQKLMAEPFIIRCYSDCAQQKSTNSDLMQKRKELEQKLSIENEKQNSHAFQHIIQSQNEKQKKLKEKISEVIDEHEKKLQNRLQLRSMKKSLISPVKKNSQDAILSSSQYRNPEITTPEKGMSSLELSIQELMSTKNFRSDKIQLYRPLSERAFNYKFSKINVDDSNSDSSEDQYQIEKRLREQKGNMGKKRSPEESARKPK